MLGYADLSLFAFFSVVHCLTWFVVSAERKRGGERNCSVSPLRRTDSFLWHGGGIVQVSQAHACVYTHLHTHACKHTHTHACTGGEHTGSGCSWIQQGLPKATNSVLALDMWKQLNSLQSASNKE